MTARLYEIHRVRVEDAQHAASVMGHVRGMMVDGTGYISGRTDTVHMANVFANGAAYSLIEVTTKLPIRIGNDLLVVCRQGKNGVWQVLSVANRSTKTSHAHSPYDGLWHYWLGLRGAAIRDPDHRLRPGADGALQRLEVHAMRFRGDDHGERSLGAACKPS